MRHIEYSAVRVGMDADKKRERERAYPFVVDRGESLVMDEVEMVSILQFLLQNLCSMPGVVAVQMNPLLDLKCGRWRVC